MSVQATLPPGSLILVTGASAYIGAPIVQQLLNRGYKVRGTVRDLSKSQWLLTDAFPKHAADGTLELVILNDIGDQKQFQTAVKGVDGVIHVATPNSLDPNPYNVIPLAMEFVVNLAKAAAAENSVRRFVFTSTIGAAVMPPARPGFHFDGSQWNEDGREIAWAPPPYTFERGGAVYIQSKTEAERAFWKFITEEKPNFTGNSVVGGTAFGPRIHEKQNPSTSAWIWALYNGDVTPTMFFDASIFVDNRDVAVIHIAALLDPSIENARLPAWGTEFYWNDILAILRKQSPERELPADLDVPRIPRMTADTTQARKALKEWGGQDDFISLEKGVMDTLREMPLHGKQA
ncbi:aldehyde reductase 2 [Trichoderma arundinaceum]|uniref:Aldehyde reductase 2 n=1 Tax=Trichoderma arundinaceum TaxID=490622 RepID=A0A395NZD8_TRIAR|nr:aldehyde reductase 2 [Trichoderma arundinaceum]